MIFDLLIKDGIIIDGTGQPRYRADIGIVGGRISKIGQLDVAARRVIDADGLVVAPGFVDPHTHYDAQICWDPMLSCSSWHGITTVVTGNCGVGVAPVRPEAREVVMWDLVNLEAIPFDALQAGIPWDWESFPEYMDAAERRGSGVNLAFLAPLTPFRHYVMGEAALERAATAQETAKIRELLLDAMRAGAVGFSTTNAKAHIGFQGRPLACVHASSDELAAYAGVLKELGRGAIAIALASAATGVNDEDYALVDRLLAESNAPLTFLALIKHLDQPNAHIEMMERLDGLIQRGARPQMHSTNLVSDLSLREPYMLSSFPSWHGLFNQTVETQMTIYRDPDFRLRFREELKNSRAFHGDFSMVWVTDVARADFEPLIGKSLTTIAAARGVDPFELFFDLALEDDLRMTYTTVRFGVPEEYLDDPRTLIGLSDAGAHVGILCNAGYTTEMLGDLVRERGLLSLEHAVKRITSEPADFFGLSDRGRLVPGLAADITIFDPETIASNSARPEVRHDLPGGGRRLVVAAHGIEYTIVNGEILYAHGEPTGARPGYVLRPGRSVV
jgi:N-acyl-D-aspartate/D-glutamate deacylase